MLNLFKPKTNYQVQISTPCHEDWDKMTEVKKGKFCASCSKTVVDFSLMSDQQIIDYFLKQPTNSCGRFNHDQLNRDLQTDKKRLYSLTHKLILLCLFVFNLIPRKLNAQISKTPIHVTNTKDSINSQTPLNQTASEPTLMKTIKGHVFDSLTKKPLSHVLVEIEETKYVTTTDSTGEYSLSIPDSLLQTGFTLIFDNETHFLSVEHIGRNEIGNELTHFMKLVEVRRGRYAFGGCAVITVSKFQGRIIPKTFPIFNSSGPIPPTPVFDKNTP
ncbi:MAG: hypothetical protein R2852_09710 [Bacteroidia bacterium]